MHEDVERCIRAVQSKDARFDGWFFTAVVTVQLRPVADAPYIECRLALTDLRDTMSAIHRCRRLLDLDADPVAVDQQLLTDPVLAPLVHRNPGRRVPRTVDGEEFAIRGQQVSTAAARTHAGRLVIARGRPVADPAGGLTHLFPTPADLTDLDLAGVALPKARRTALRGLIEALTAKGIDLRAGSDWRRSCAQLAGLRGIGPWTVATIAMRALGDPDAFPATDLGVRLAAAGLGLPGTPAAEHAASWRPWRAYAVQYLWAAGDHAVNRLPGDDVAAPTAGSAVGAAAWGETK